VVVQVIGVRLPILALTHIPILVMRCVTKESMRGEWVCLAGYVHQLVLLTMYVISASRHCFRGFRFLPDSRAASAHME